MIKFFTVFLISIIDKYVHQKKLEKFFFRIKSDIKIVLDVGCHEGDYSVLLKKVFKDSYIHAFEPNISLKTKIESKKSLKKNFIVNYISVSDTDDNILMIIDNEVSKISTGSSINYKSKTYKVKKLLYSSNENKDSKNRIMVPSTRIDTYLDKKNLIADFVKIDVEGLELKVLKGFSKNISKTEYIMIEHHKDNLYMDSNSQDVDSFLKQNNFKLIFSIKFPFMNWEDRIYENQKL